MLTLEEKDQIFQSLLQQNQTCFDCDQQNPTYASVNNGIFLCEDCTNIHLNLIQQFSILRSIQKDSWTQNQIKYLQFGGNQKLKDYFKQYSIQSNSPAEFKYKTKACQHYRQQLHGKVLQNNDDPSLEEGLQLIIEKDQNKQNQLIETISDVGQKLGQGVNYTIGEVYKFSQSETGQQIQEKVKAGSQIISNSIWTGLSFISNQVQKTTQQLQKQNNDDKNHQYSENEQ